MKVSSIFIATICSVIAFCNADGQSLLDRKIDLHLKKVSYIDVLHSIEHTTGIHFVYQPVLFQDVQKIDVESRQESVRALLNRLLMPLGIRYELANENYVILTKADKAGGSSTRNTASADSSLALAPLVRMIYGIVTSESLPVPGTSVMIEGTSRGTATDDNGKFQLQSLRPGFYKLLITHVGHPHAYREVNVSDHDVYLQINLPSDPLDMQQVLITSMGIPKTKIESSIAVTTITAKHLEERAPLNSVDAIKTIPGVSVLSGGGDGPGNVRVRGLASGGGYQFFGIMEDGLPVLPTGFGSVPSSDQYYKIDLSIKNIEASRGGNTALVMANTPGALMNIISNTGANKTYGKFRLTRGLSQNLIRLDGNLGGSINKKLQYNIGGFYRYDEGIKPPSFTANNGGQVKANLTWRFNEKSFVRIYLKYLNDRVQWLLPGIYPYNKDHRGYAFSEDYDMYRDNLTPHHTQFDVRLPEGSIHHFDLEEGYHTKLGYAGFLFQHQNSDWLIKNNFRYQHSRMYANFVITTTAPAFDPNRSYYFPDGSKLSNPNGYYALQQVGDNNRLESQIMDYLDITKKFQHHNLTFGAGLHIYDVIDHEAVNAVIATEIKDKPSIILLDSATAPMAIASSTRNPGGHLKYNGITNMLSAYVLDEFALHPKLHLEAGIRLDYFSLHGDKAKYDGTSVVNGGEGFVIDGMNPWTDEHLYWSATVALNYKIQNTLSWFLRGTRSYSAFSIDDFVAIDFDPANLRKRQIIMCELGVKYTQDRLSVFSSLVYANGRNLPLNTNVPGANGTLFIQNGFASMRSFGWETEATYRVFKGFNFRLISTIQDPVFTDYTIKISQNARPDIAGTEVDWTGNRPQVTPNWVFVTEGSYSISVFNFFANAIFTGPTWSTTANTYKLPAYAEVMAGIGARLFKRKVETRVWANNLLDSRALTAGNVRGEQFINEDDLVIGQPMLGRANLPRSFWVSIAYNL